MQFRVKQVQPLRLFHVNFKHYLDMTLSLLRMQEFYESPKFKGHFFTLEDYIRWYCAEYKKSFDYVTDVGGMNIPGDVVVQFMKIFYFENGDEYPLSDMEFEVIEELIEQGILDWQLMNRGTNPTDFYLIATYGSCKNLEAYLAHEIRHALFYLTPEYRDAILEVLRQHDNRTVCKFYKLIKKDYNKTVVHDEIQAYALTGFDPYYKCPISALPKGLQALRADLKKVERKFIRKGKIYVPTG